MNGHSLIALPGAGRTHPRHAPLDVEARIEPLDSPPTPAELRATVPLTQALERTVAGAREALTDILSGEDQRLVLVVGPCSIHDPEAALEYGRKLRALAQEVSSSFLIIMRTYFEKPRTRGGWRGLLVDPSLDGSFRSDQGVTIARQLLRDLTELGVPCGTEFLGQYTPHYLGDLITWGAIGARSSGAQPHREMASALPMPVGMKHGVDGNIESAIDSIRFASQPTSFLGAHHDSGRPVVVHSRGNAHPHLVLRGSRLGPNYDRASLTHCAQELERAALPARVVVDCSHDNSGKDHERQPAVFNHCIGEVAGGDRLIRGLMLESNLHAGKQALTDNPADLRRGVSITDACVDWDTTAELIYRAHLRLSASTGTRRPSGSSRRHASLISSGIVEPLHHMPFHANGTAPLTRHVLAGSRVHPEVRKHIVAHEIREVSAARRAYCEPHVHDCDELNVLMSLTGLTYEIRLEDEVYIVKAPATIRIPAGVAHSANVIEGSGYYLAMLETSDYMASVRRAP